MILTLRHPARHFIYYLISRQSHKIKALVEQLSELGIPLPQEGLRFQDFVKRLILIQKSMKIPGDFEPTAARPNASTMRFLNTWKIGSMWRKDVFTARAEDMLHEAPIRRSIEVMLMGPLQADHIAKRVRSRWALPEEVMNARVIRDYSHYFWNPNALHRAEWKSFFFECYPPKTDNLDYAMAMNVSRSKEGAMLVLALSDRGADGLTNAEFYHMMRNASGLAFLQHAFLEYPSVARATAMLSTITSFKMAAEELDKHRGGSAELLDELRKMEPVYDRSQVTSIYDLPIERHALPAPIDATLVDDEEEHEEEEVSNG